MCRSTASASIVKMCLVAVSAGKLGPQGSGLTEVGSWQDCLTADDGNVSAVCMHAAALALDNDCSGAGHSRALCRNIASQSLGAGQVMPCIVVAGAVHSALVQPQGVNWQPQCTGCCAHTHVGLKAAVGL